MTDIEIVKEIEKELGVELEEVDKIQWSTKGYVLDNQGRVTGLGLYNCEIENPQRIYPYLKKLNHLTQLDLNDNQLKDISVLQNLTGLTHLYLSNNQPTDISALQGLTGLIVLHLDGNQLRDVSILQGLTGLTELNLSSNLLTDISVLASLTNLKRLFIHSSSQRDISMLGVLTDLTLLFLSNNNVTDISALKSLKDLKILYLSHNQLKDISVLQSLIGLTQLDLRNNQLTEVSPLSGLVGLTELNLASNQLTEVSPLSGLVGLTELNLASNQLRDISPLSGLSGLTELNLSYNQLTDVSPLSGLSVLTVLDLRNNQLTDVSPLSGLLKKGVPISLGWWVGGPKIIVGNNPLKNPPIEIVEQGTEAVLNYFAEKERAGEEMDYLFEAKLMVVGEERAGKSTLIEAITNPKFQIDEHKSSTHGIQISQWKIDKVHTATDKDFRFNVWDFGGQVIYHSTHQFFLTRRALYLFVTEARKDLRYEDFYYWLNIINTLAGNSPVLMIQNKTDQDHNNPDIGIYKEAFEQIEGELQSISCNTKHEDWEIIYKPKLEIFKHEIYKIIKEKKLEGIGDKLPKVWVDIRKEIGELQKEGVNYISLKKYYAICAKKGLDKDRALFLSGYFHELGVFLHFKGDIQLNETIFINHDWVTKAIYNVFDNKKVKDNKGVFTNEDLINIWSDEQFNGKHAELAALMKTRKFKLCYMQDKFYLAPQLFSDKPVEYTWDTDSDNLFFQFSYTFMPKGILSQLIVVLHTDIFENKFWKRGVIFKYKNSKALVKDNSAQNKNSITIKAEGAEKKELLSIIRHKIEEINATYTHLQVSNDYGCRCVECEAGIEPHYFSEDEIRRAKKKNKKTLECKLSFDAVEINQLLGDYIPKEPKGKNSFSFFEDDRLEDLMAETRGARKEIRDIKNSIDKQYQFLINQPANQSNMAEIEATIKQLLAIQTKEINTQIIGFITEGLSAFDEEMNEKFADAILEIKQSDNWETYVKLGIPLMNLTGVNVEHKFKLNKYIKEIKQMFLPEK